MSAFGETDYRGGARERLDEAYVLLRNQRFGGSIYIAGRAVEGILRAVIWKGDPDYALGKKSLETGHNLRDMMKLVRNLGVFRENRPRDLITNNVQRIGRLWWNNMRFTPLEKIRKDWYNLGEISGKRTMRQAAQEFYDACGVVVRECEYLWRK
jgi:hypothetical protein